MLFFCLLLLGGLIYPLVDYCDLEISRVNHTLRILWVALSAFVCCNFTLHSCGQTNL